MLGGDDPHHPRRVDVLHLRRRRRDHRRRTWILCGRHALSLATCPDGSTVSRRCRSRPARSSTSRPRSSCAIRRAGGLGADELLIRRERFVTDDLQEHVVVTNLAGDAVTVELAVELASDFADILSIKHHDFALGDPGLADGAAAARRTARRGDAAAPRTCSTPRACSRPRCAARGRHSSSGSALWFALELGPHAEWDVRLTFRPGHRARAAGAHPARPSLRRAAGAHPALARAPGTCTCRSCAPRGPSSARPMRAPSRISRRCACAAATASACCPRRACRGS